MFVAGPEHRRLPEVAGTFQSRIAAQYRMVLNCGDMPTLGAEGLKNKNKKLEEREKE